MRNPVFRYDARGECPVQWKKREKVTLFYLGSDPPPPGPVAGTVGNQVLL